MIVYNFLETYDLSGKTVLPFSTNEGSGLAGTQSAITSKCPNATVLDGLAIRGQTAQNNQSETERAVASWLDTQMMSQRSELDARMKRPPLPLSISQIGLVGGSGMINGLIECDSPPYHQGAHREGSPHGI